MKKHNFDIALISPTAVNLGLSFSQGDVPESLVGTIKNSSQGYMLEIGFFLLLELI